ncbi:hypothetical protein LSAT2_021594 [Lamellibrachia satsuma]|nr:hypothetical protein LSAT2_021594 [Lamellibrachia satsuma]
MGLSTILPSSRVAVALILSKLVVLCWFSAPLKERLRYSDVAAWVFLAGVLNVCCPNAPLLPKFSRRHVRGLLTASCAWLVYRSARCLVKMEYVGDVIAAWSPGAVNEETASVMYIAVISSLTAMAYFTRRGTDQALFVDAADKTTTTRVSAEDKKRKPSSVASMPRELIRLHDSEMWSQQRSERASRRCRACPTKTRSLTAGEYIPLAVSEEYVTFVNSIRLNKDLPDSEGEN